MTTKNNGIGAVSYVPQYLKIFNAAFGAQSAFAGVLAPLQTLDGVQHNAKAFSVKTSAVPVVVGTDYLTGAKDGGFGDGSGKKSRFGDMTEVVYEDTDVNYSYELTFHEGLDKFTVNNDMQQAIADRMKLRSQAWVRAMNKKVGDFLSANAGGSEALANLTEEKIKALFNKMRAYYTNKEVLAPVTVYLRTEVYNAIIDMASTTTAKGSAVSVDENGLAKYKGFKLVETPEQYFGSGDIAYFSPDAIVVPFVGIETLRTIEARDFEGVEMQGAAKGGHFVLDDNKVAVVRVTGTIV